MFSFVSGTIEAKDTNILVINCNGVGFELNVSETTNFEVGNVGAVMDGDLDGFVNAYLIAKSKGEL